MSAFLDELISAASGRILSSDAKNEPSGGLNRKDSRIRYDSIGSWGPASHSYDRSSISLMRESIIRSIASSQASEKTVYQNGLYGSGTLRNRNNFCSITQPKIHTEYFRKERSASTTQSELLVERSNTTEESTMSPVSTNTNIENCPKEPQCHAVDDTSVGSEIKNIDASCAGCVDVVKDGTPTENDETSTENAQKSGNTIQENGLALACRNSSESIYESCSTYDITCQDVSLSKSTKPRASEPTKFKRVSFSTLEFDSRTERDTKQNIIKSGNKRVLPKSTDMETGEKSPDCQIVLSDSFFPGMVNGEIPHNFNCKAQSNCLENPVMKQTSSARDLAKEVKCPNSEVLTNQIHSSGLSVKPSKSRLRSNRRTRKRSRRNSKKQNVYECQKCGISFLIPTRAMNDVARCLYCDLCTSVEPVFEKHEKQSWNTCCVC